MVKLDSHYTRKKWAHYSIDKWKFRDAPREQIDILNMLIVILETSTLRARHVLIQLLERCYFLKKDNKSVH